MGIFRQKAKKVKLHGLTAVAFWRAGKDEEF
jgi:hypothetical protein